MAFLDDAIDHIAGAHGIDRARLSLSPADGTTLLELAGLAAHASGDRTNAPLLCHVLGIARAEGIPLDALAATVRAFAGGDARA